LDKKPLTLPKTVSYVSHPLSHDPVEPATRAITAQLVERRPLFASPGAADAVILVDPDDLAPHPAHDLAQLAFLIGRGLIDCTDAEIDHRSAHGFSSLQAAGAEYRKICAGNWASKIARFLRFSARAFRGVFSSTSCHPAPAAKRHIRSALRCLCCPGRGLSRCSRDLSTSASLRAARCGMDGSR